MMPARAYDNWPFQVAPAEDRSPQESQAIGFLQKASARGFEAYRYGVNDYGARNESREGWIIERGRTRWEIRLAEAEKQALSAFLGDFDAASAAVCAWLDGTCAQEILANVSSFLIAMPGAKSSYVLTECGTGR